MEEKKEEDEREGGEREEERENISIGYIKQSSVLHTRI